MEIHLVLTHALYLNSDACGFGTNKECGSQNKNKKIIVT